MLLQYLSKHCCIGLHCVPAQLDCQTIEVLQRETPKFIPLYFWPSNRPDLIPVDHWI